MADNGSPLLITHVHHFNRLAKPTIYYPIDQFEHPDMPGFVFTVGAYQITFRCQYCQVFKELWVYK